MGKRVRWQQLLLIMATVFLVVPFGFSPASARVSWIEITSTTPYAGGMSFGNVGPYQEVRGRLHYAVDPDNRYNQQIVDLQLAKTGQLRQDLSVVHPTSSGKGYVEEIVGAPAVNAKGEVEFVGDFILLRPADLSKGNHRIFYEVNNRGNLLALTYYNDAPGGNDPDASVGNGWLMRQGYSILWTGWNWDVENVGTTAAAGPAVRIWLPIVTADAVGTPLIEKINAEISVELKTTAFDWVAWGNSRCYYVDPGRQNEATLTMRDNPDVDRIDDAARTLIARSTWRFGRIYKDGAGNQQFDASDPTNAISVDGGLQKGKIYELLYHAKNPRVVGLGLAAIRDALSFFHFETQDDHGNLNPLAVPKNKNKLTVDPEYAYVFGISQSGRVITTMIYEGFHVDEKGRMVFEGTRPDVPGGGKGAFNYRWAQTTHHPKHIEANYFPADHFPFNFTKEGVYQQDPYRTRDGVHGDVLAVAKRLQSVPKIMLSNHETEYWTRAASLVHTDVLGMHDALDITHPNVRFYLFNGSQHSAPSPTSKRTNANDAHSDGLVYFQPIGRALLVALDQWVSGHKKPPESVVPLLAKGELITVGEHTSKFFAAIPRYDRIDPTLTTNNALPFPAMRNPGTYLKPPRADYGPRFFMPMPWPSDKAPVAYPGIQDNVPPQYFGPPYETRVPAFDADGNGIGGIRPIELQVPLGTYQGWNPRCDSCGATNYLQPFNVSFWPFPIDATERTAKNDPRPSIAERYANQDVYVAKVTETATNLKEQGFMLDEDVQSAVQKAQNMVWPPVPTIQFPFWQMR
jgi:hypothetical protein